MHVMRTVPLEPRCDTNVIVAEINGLVTLAGGATPGSGMQHSRANDSSLSYTPIIRTASASSTTAAPPSQRNTSQQQQVPTPAECSACSPSRAAVVS